MMLNSASRCTWAARSSVLDSPAKYSTAAVLSFAARLLSCTPTIAASKSEMESIRAVVFRCTLALGEYLGGANVWGLSSCSC